MHPKLNFDTATDIILENERVLLRPLVQEDAVFLSPYVKEEPTLWKYALTPITTDQEFEQYIATAIETRHLKSAYPFIAFDKLQKKYVGSTRFYDIQLNNSSTQFGYTWYSECTWGTGLNEHCKLLLLEFAFETIGFERVDGGHGIHRAIKSGRMVCACRSVEIARNRLGGEGRIAKRAKTVKRARRRHCFGAHG